MSQWQAAKADELVAEGIAMGTATDTKVIAI